MATILDLPEYRNLTGLASTTDAARDAALQSIITEVNDAITRYLRQPIDSDTYTEYYDAPPTPRIVLKQWPVTAVTTVKVATGSNGDPSKFTDDTEWDQYTDWILETDQSDGSSRCGVLRAVRGYWGVEAVRPVNRIATRTENSLRAVQVTYVAGYDQPPASLKTAAMMLTSRIYLMRKNSLILSSASLNGASYGSQFPPGVSWGVLLGDPTIADFLRPFCDIFV